jgi:hypothetical protein
VCNQFSVDLYRILIIGLKRSSFKAVILEDSLKGRVLWVNIKII